MAKQPSNQNSPGNHLRPLMIILGIFCLSLLLFLLWMSQISNLSPPELILKFKNSLYFPNMNQFIIEEINGKNVLKLFYGFIFLGTLIMSAGFMLFIYAPDTEQAISYPQAVTLISIIALLLFSGVQQIHRFDYFSHEKKSLAGKTVHEKNLVLFGAKYEFAYACQKALPNNHQGTLITDFDLKKSPYMFYHRLLSYHLYPKVSLRLKNDSPEDILFLFYKENPSEYIPENYKILLSTEDQNYILAIKKQAIK